MENKTNEVQQINATPNRKLSLWRVILATLVLVIVIYTAMNAIRGWETTQASEDIEPWFAPYVDVTATPRYAFEQVVNENIKNVMLAFIVADPDDACAPSWGGYYTLEEASGALDLDRRIARFRQQDGNIAVSFGGLLNNELAVTCNDDEALAAAYTAVIDRYAVDTIDFDIEGDALDNIDSLKRRAQVIAEVQKAYRTNDKSLAVWLTLPVTPQGLTPSGTNAIEIMLTQGVDLAGVNIMTMDYGENKDKYLSMQEASEMALTETHRQLEIIYSRSGITLSDATLWKKLGSTPMIGQNDILNEIFTLANAKGFNQFAIDRGIARMSMWSLNRDIQCGDNYVNVTIVSDACSGITQDEFAFTNILSMGFYAQMKDNADSVTIEETLPTVMQDDPATSPYQIWHENGVYLQGTKVVWHGNVYQAKWWTKGDLPDNPVLQSWETPWQLVGPVLPGEQPIKLPTLPEGTYPDWSGLTIYEAGERVLFDGVPYQAKWWTQGDSPAAATSNPDSSPWIALTEQEIEEILEGIR